MPSAPAARCDRDVVIYILVTSDLEFLLHIKFCLRLQSSTIALAITFTTTLLQVVTLSLARRIRRPLLHI